ncbi:type II toxin-antitoxin system HipA family toxin [Micropruina sp.]|uniref:type II toxin-antitoxin system HipA family toxin n=1 Tax=Micropruina sp. TaxID=2737536 RepID=UPI0039E51327
MPGELAVLLYGRQVAQLVEGHGHRSLHYGVSPGNTPVSLSMPIQAGRHGNRVVEPYLNGLLPDRPDVRAAMGRELGVSGNNPFALLRHAGLDCAGAVQFCEPDRVQEALARPGSLERVEESEIARRIGSVLDGSMRSWIAPAERWSLAGAQAKFALHRDARGGWSEPGGATPSTHIIKPGIPELFDQALNEHVCMCAGRALGLDMAASEYTEFESLPAIVVQRYDRRADAQGDVVRIHQEDLCQALSVPPDKKYETDGGPGAAAILRVLSQNAAGRDRERFVVAQAFNYLIGGTDAHAKNLSVLLVGRMVRLAPLYDVASGFPYEGLAMELPIAVGGERRFGFVRDRHWVKLANQARLDGDRVLGIVHDLARRVPDALRDAFAEVPLSRSSTATGLRERMLAAVRQQCESVLRGW